MLLYFVQGTLPWQEMKSASRKKKEQLLVAKKLDRSGEDLCSGLLPEFTIYMQYVRRLKTHEKPDYRYLRSLFDQSFRRQGFEYDSVFDWTLLEFLRLLSLSDIASS